MLYIHMSSTALYYIIVYSNCKMYSCVTETNIFTNRISLSEQD